jgi:hypothetical protein
MSEAREIAEKLYPWYRTHRASKRAVTTLDAAVQFVRSHMKGQSEQSIDNTAWILHQMSKGTDYVNIYNAMVIVVDLARLNMLDSKNDPAKYASQMEAIETIERLYDL